MAFCRFGADGSDVYCFYSIEGHYEVWSVEGEHTFSTPEETLLFLNELKQKGETVPNYAFEGLAKELKPGGES